MTEPTEELSSDEAVQRGCVHSDDHGCVYGPEVVAVETTRAGRTVVFVRAREKEAD